MDDILPSHDLIIHEMLRKKGKATQHNRKTKQHNTTRPRQLFFKEKIAASGGTRTHDRPLARQRSYQLSYRGSMYSIQVYVHHRFNVLSHKSDILLSHQLLRGALISGDMRVQTRHSLTLR